MRFDVAVIGAGPAGSWAAFQLARGGVRVALVDASHPREKPCGGGVTGRALALVNGALGAELHSISIRSVRFREGADSRTAVIDLDDRDGGSRLVVASRRDFDGGLRRAAGRAGAELVDARATHVSPDGPGWTIDLAGRESIRAGAIVGADGANSLVRRRLSVPFRRDQLSIGTGFFAHDVTSAEIVLELESSPPGYLWSFPRPDHLAVGVCADASGSAAGPLRARAERWIADARLAPGARLEAYSWPIPSLSPADLGAGPVAGRRWLLVGDAAGLVDPITREGIYYALRSSELAAAALQSDGVDPGRAYVNALAADILPELRAAANLQAGFFRPRFASLLIRALRESAAVRGVMADLISGTQSYRSLKRRLLQTFEFGLALRLLAQKGHQGLVGTKAAKKAVKADARG